MNKKSEIILRNLSLFTFLAIYVVLAVTLLFLEAFVAETQYYVITTLLPFFLLGLILDYVVSRNKVLLKGYKIFTQLLPAGIFLLYGLSQLLRLAGRPHSAAFNYLIWLFIAAPFFIAGYQKEGNRSKILFSILGTGLMAASYLYLTTKTRQLDGGSGFVVYMICYFMMFYAASGLPRLAYLGVVFGFMNAVVLLLLWKYPVTQTARLYGWDYDISYNFELLMLTTFILCILVCLITSVYRERAAARKRA